MPLPPLVDPAAALSARERERTARHLALAGLGELGQRRLAAAHVAVVGAGGLGSPVVLALAAAGVGSLTVIDDDVIELSNLQRQVMHRREDAGTLKADSAVRAAAALSDTRVIPVARRLTAANAQELLAHADIVIDGSDLFATREAVAAATDRLGIPLVWGTVQEFDAQATVFWSAPPAGRDPVVLADLYPPGSAGAVPTCAEVGVLGALCLQVGSLLALEAIKLIAGIGEPLLGRVLVIDALGARQREVPLRGARASASAPPTGSSPGPIRVVTPDDLDRLDDATILDVRETHEVATGTIPGAVHLPLDLLLADPSAVRGPVVVVCQSSVRARRAAEALRAAGVEAAVLAGGMRAWCTHARAVVG
ncbi:MAG: ThiF family adenylyltransferase [Microbacterium sp.]